MTAECILGLCSGSSGPYALRDGPRCVPSSVRPIVYKRESPIRQRGADAAGSTPEGLSLHHTVRRRALTIYMALSRSQNVFQCVIELGPRDVAAPPLPGCQYKGVP